MTHTYLTYKGEDSELYYNGFILNKGKSTKQPYKYRKDQLEVIVGLLTQAREEMPRPFVYEATLGLGDSKYIGGMYIPTAFDPKQLKTVLKADKYLYHWTIEHSKYMGLHAHVMIIFSRDRFNPDTHWVSLRPKFLKLKGVKSAMINKRHCGLGMYHNLNDDSDYVDAVKRFTYQAKIDQKNTDYVKGRSFGSSQVKKVFKDVSCKLDCAALLAEVDANKI